MARSTLVFCAGLAALSGCGRLSEVGKTPELTTVSGGNEHFAMSAGPVFSETLETRPAIASLWTGGRSSLLGDRRAAQRGDILTVVIEIDDRAEFSNSSSRSRSAGESLGIDNLFGLPQSRELPGGATLNEAVDIGSDSDFKGDGAIRRRERLTLQVAATVIEVMPNGALRIEGTQEVRINNEVRVLLVTGFVRSEDITRQNQITYEKIASARISYGGRGHITDVQQPRIGQQIADIVLPFLTGGLSDEDAPRPPPGAPRRRRRRGGAGLVLAPDHGTEAGSEASHGDAAGHGEPSAPDYMPFSREFVIPLVSDGRVRAHVVLNLALQSTLLTRDDMLFQEPALRDRLMEAVFRHAATGGFDGMFTDALPMNRLRLALNEAVVPVVRPATATVLITSVDRRDR